MFFISFWIGKPEIIAGWLVFKVGSKWENWTNIIKVPEKKKSDEGIHFLFVRHNWGTYIFTRFIVGTLSNIIISMIGTGVSFMIIRVSQ